jgi:sphingomyelin phosphodiesterase
LDLFVKQVTEEIQPDFIIWTGDNPSHTPWNLNYDEVYNSTKTFVKLLTEKYNYKKPVFVAFGNHESKITDMFNVFNKTEYSGFLSSMQNILKDFITEDSEIQTFKQFGYYSTKLPNTNLRIISFNTFVCDIFNFYLIENPTDPFYQFSWLEHTLRKAEKSGEQVFLISHIPPGDTNYMSECGRRFRALIDRFQGIIKGQFYGHTHFDEMKVVGEYYNSKEISGVEFIAPSLTTYSFQNPSFRVFEMDEDTKILLNYHQYRLNLTEANSLADSEKPKFKVSYDAKSFFNVSHLQDASSLKKNLDKIFEDENQFKRLVFYFFGEGTTDYEYYVSNRNLQKYFRCRYNIYVLDDYIRCTNFQTWDYTDYINLLVESLSGKWYKKYIHKNAYGKGSLNYDLEDKDKRLK